MPIPSQPTTNISLGPTLAPTNRSISAEFSDPAPHAISEFYRGGARVPNNPLNSGIPTGGAIAFSQFNGATSAPAIIPIVYTLSSVQNLNLLSYATSPARPAPTRYTAGTPGYSIEFQIPAPVVIGSATRAQDAMVTGASGPTGWHPDVSVFIQNSGAILGAGGPGGGGGFLLNVFEPAPIIFIPASAGNAGGTAVVAQRAITIQNSGTVAGGSGGGGGGGFFAPPSTYRDGGGGGGGAGQTAGGGGARGTGEAFPESVAGQPGSATTGGAGGLGSGSSPTTKGGDGGSRSPSLPVMTGQAGEGSAPGPGGAGGAAGFYAKGDANITWQATGTRNGQVQPTV